MFAAVRHPLAHAITTLAVLVALVALGFGHAAHASHSHHNAALDPSLRAFLDAGGALSDVCGEDRDQTAHLGICPVCHLVSGFAMPEAGAQGAVIALRTTPVEWHAPLTLNLPPKPHIGHGSRAPPTI
ncbi:MAG: hypothetical protein AAFZ04_13580 [Pseudomonadota bacterium]